jgi:predicted ester cyclase
LTSSFFDDIVEAVSNTAGEKRETGGQYMPAEENKAIARREIEELYNHTGNLDAANEIYAPDYVGHDPTLPEDLHGVEAARQYAATFRSAFPDLTCTIEDQIAEGEGGNPL